MFQIEKLPTVEKKISVGEKMKGIVKKYGLLLPMSFIMASCGTSFDKNTGTFNKQVLESEKNIKNIIKVEDPAMVEELGKIYSVLPEKINRINVLDSVFNKNQQQIEWCQIEKSDDEGTIGIQYFTQRLDNYDNLGVKVEDVVFYKDGVLAYYAEFAPEKTGQVNNEDVEHSYNLTKEYHDNPLSQMDNPKSAAKYKADSVNYTGYQYARNIDNVAEYKEIANESVVSKEEIAKKTKAILKKTLEAAEKEFTNKK